MMRMYCDGCWERGIERDMTGNEIQATTVALTPSEVIHLCPERCSKLYYEHRESIRTLQARTVREYHERRDSLKKELWEMFRDAEKADADSSEPEGVRKQDDQGSAEGQASQ